MVGVYGRRDEAPKDAPGPMNVSFCGKEGGSGVLADVIKLQIREITTDDPGGP